MKVLTEDIYTDLRKGSYEYDELRRRIVQKLINQWKPDASVVDHTGRAFWQYL